MTRYIPYAVSAALFFAYFAQASVKTYFSTSGYCEQEILHQIYSAKSEIDVQAYELTNWNIIRALSSEASKGINVKIILDHHHNSPSYVEHLKQIAPAHVYFDPCSAIAHEKVIIIDQKILLTGSYNLTWSAEHRNIENLLEIKDNKTVQEHLNYFNYRKALCK